MSKRKLSGGSVHNGRFVVCPASDVVHPRTGRPAHPRLLAPVYEGPSGAFFADCIVCRRRMFLADFWVRDMGILPSEAARLRAMLPATFPMPVNPPRIVAKEKDEA